MVSKQKTHSILSASSAHRWLNCPGSIRMQAGLPISRPSDAALEGTAAHQLAEFMLEQHFKNPDFDYRLSLDTMLSEEVHVTGDEYVQIPVTEEMREAVALYVEAVLAEYIARQPGAELYVEEQFKLDKYHPDLSGTNDAVVAQEFGLMTVFDLKYGRGVIVEADDNVQLMIYALGALEKHPTCESIDLVIVQPRAGHTEGPIRKWSTTPEELLAWAQKTLAPGAKHAMSKTAPVMSGPWCQFCRAVAVCPAVRAQAASLAKVAFDDTPALTFPDPGSMSGAELSKVLQFSKLFSGWVGEVESYVKAMLERGVVVPGWKLVHGRASRKWFDEALVISKLGKIYGAEVYEEPALRSVAQMEKMIKANGGDPALEFQDLVDVTRPITLAPESDKREAIIPAIQAFNDGGN